MYIFTKADVVHDPLLSRYAEAAEDIVVSIFQQGTSEPQILDTSDLTSDQEAWLLTFLTGEVARHLGYGDIKMIDFTPEQIATVIGLMRRWFAIEVGVALENPPQYVQLKFTQLALDEV